jgi:RHS repeat-associated protein
MTRLLAPAGGVLSSNFYAYNNGHQRTRTTRANGSTVDYTYDPIGQLVGAIGKEPGAGTPVRQLEDLRYVYDPAGNLFRRTNNTTTSPLIQTFGVNALNQLTNVTPTGTVTVFGTTGTNATAVNVNGLVASNYLDATFAKGGFALSTSSYTATAQDALGRTSTQTITVPGVAPVNFRYDANGNLISDGQRASGYDDEDRLVLITVNNQWQTEFAYDGLGRRILRTERVWKTGTWTNAAVVRYINDGRLPIQERDANNIPRVTYTRGLDLSGSLFGAGGIGGLLARTEVASGQSAFYHSDAGGNVLTLVNSSNAVVARYLYDPYGNLLSASGLLADANLYRFSSKEWHPASGLYYYGFRFYEPNLQRWLNRDPLGELGGINLYQFVLADPANTIDPTGLDIWHINDPNRVGGAGHAGAIVGRPGGNNFTYHSFGSKNGSPSGAEEYTELSFTSLAAAMDWARAHGYRRYAQYCADAERDAAARKRAKEFAKHKYNVTCHNCQLMVNDMMEAAKVTWYGNSLPNQTYEKNLDLAEKEGKP